MTPEKILDFWFKETEPKSWWRKDAAFDQVIRDRYLATHQAATRCELYRWRATPRGRLAEIIVLDQFSRNLYRDDSRAFSHDALALALAQEAVSIGADIALETQERAFLYMPYMHSESTVIHAEAVRLFSAPGLESNLDFEFRHKAIIDRFGRYPHRNAVMGRVSTLDEMQFLSEPGSSF